MGVVDQVRNDEQLLLVWAIVVTIEVIPFTMAFAAASVRRKKVSGSAYTYSGYWPKSALQQITGESKCWRRTSHSGLMALSVSV